MISLHQGGEPHFCSPDTNGQGEHRSERDMLIRKRNNDCSRWLLTQKSQRNQITLPIMSGARAWFAR
jgi:hypothetical protein